MENAGFSPERKIKAIKSGISMWIITSFILAQPHTYEIVDTGQETFYDDTTQIETTEPGDAFYGQDAQFVGNQPQYQDNGDGTVTDLVTGLIWQKAVGEKMAFDEAIAGADTFSLADYFDWRLPTIKELYSLILFSGLDPSGWEGGDTDLLIPFIDTNYFEFEYGDESAGERIIDAQYWSSTAYVSTTMGGDETVFGVNFADGRIKGYPSEPVGPPGQEFTMTAFVKYVHGSSEYGVNNFINNSDGTVTDQATGLMWQQGDSETGLNWENALNWVQQKNTENYLGYSDWRLPNTKEFQSIVDYSRSPVTTNSAAINPLFTCTVITDEGGETNYPFYWASTTHENMVNGRNAVYICFGEALGWMQPPTGGDYVLMDVHGAGAQRSDPKSGDPADYPYGHGPQGDVIRINNYVRCVRGGDVTTVGIDADSDQPIPSQFRLGQNYPNPFNPVTTISYQIPRSRFVHLAIYNIVGQLVETLVNGNESAGNHSIIWNANKVSSGLYLYKITAGDYSAVKKCLILK